MKDLLLWGAVVALLYLMLIVLCGGFGPEYGSQLR